jgi:hypothetical protein
VLGKLLDTVEFTDRPEPFTVSVAEPLETVYTMVELEVVETPPTLYASAPEKSSLRTKTLLLM